MTVSLTLSKSHSLDTSRLKQPGDEACKASDTIMNTMLFVNRIRMSRGSQFIIYESLLIILGFAIAAQVAPPDIYSQIIGTLVVLAVTLPLSYWLVYKRQ